MKLPSDMLKIWQIIFSYNFLIKKQFSLRVDGLEPKIDVIIKPDSKFGTKDGLTRSVI
jgi:hypothetical protein